MRRTAPLLLAVLALAGCGIELAGHTVFTSWGQAALVVLGIPGILGLLGVVVFAVRRQRTVRDDLSVTAVRAISGADGAPLALYVYNSEGVYVFDIVGDTFPLSAAQGGSWRDGGLTGRHYSEMIPVGPVGDEAREAYVRVLADAVPACYERPETRADGEAVVIEYHHTPLPAGGGTVMAYDVTRRSEITRRLTAERDEARQVRADAAEAHAAALLASAEAERALTRTREAGFKARLNTLETATEGGYGQPVQVPEPVPAQ